MGLIPALKDKEKIGLRVARLGTESSHGRAKALDLTTSSAKT